MFVVELLIWMQVGRCRLTCCVGRCLAPSCFAVFGALLASFAGLLTCLFLGIVVYAVGVAVMIWLDTL